MGINQNGIRPYVDAMTSMAFGMDFVQYLHHIQITEGEPFSRGPDKGSLVRLGWERVGDKLFDLTGRRHEIGAPHYQTVNSWGFRAVTIRQTRAIRAQIAEGGDGD